MQAVGSFRLCFGYKKPSLRFGLFSLPEQEQAFAHGCILLGIVVIILGMGTVTESYRYITRRPGVRGGNAIVEHTRIGVHDIIGLLQNGETVDTVTSSCLPALTRAQVYESLAYYEDHRGEIDVLVARQMASPDA